MVINLILECVMYGLMATAIALLGLGAYVLGLGIRRLYDLLRGR